MWTTTTPASDPGRRAPDRPPSADPVVRYSCAQLFAGTPPRAGGTPGRPDDEGCHVDMKLELVPIPVTEVDRAKPSTPSGSGSPWTSAAEPGTPRSRTPTANTLTLQEMAWRTGGDF